MSEPRDDVVVARLLAQARAGDGVALGELLEAFRDDLKTQADRIVGGRMAGRVDASDLVQATCLSIHRKIEEFVGSDAAQFAAWLRRVHERNVQNALRDNVYAQKRAAGAEQPLDDRDVSDPRPETPSRAAMWNETNERLMAALEALPADERQALRLRYLEGKTLAELCGELDLTRDAAVWLMQKGMRRLRTQLKDESF